MFHPSVGCRGSAGVFGLHILLSVVVIVKIVQIVCDVGGGKFLVWVIFGEIGPCVAFVGQFDVSAECGRAEVIDPGEGVRIRAPCEVDAGRGADVVGVESSGESVLSQALDEEVEDRAVSTPSVPIDGAGGSAVCWVDVTIEMEGGN